MPRTYDLGSKKYEVETTPEFEKQVKKKHRSKKQQYKNTIEKLKKNPKAYGKPLKSVKGMEELKEKPWEIRFGKSHRIIYTINHKEKIVTLEGIKHHKNLSPKEISKLFK